MESKRNKNEVALLPKHFKKIGLIVMILAFVPAVVVKSMNVEMVQSQKELFRIFTLNTAGQAAQKCRNAHFVQRHAWTAGQAAQKTQIAATQVAATWTAGQAAQKSKAPVQGGV